MSYPVIQSEQTTVNTGISATITVDKPDNAAEGDMLLAIISGRRRATAGDLTADPTPEGWEVISSDGSAEWGHTESCAAYKILGDTEPSNYTFTFTNTNLCLTARIIRITGVNPANPIAAYSHVVDDVGTATDAVATGVTAGDNLLIYMGCGGNSSSTTDPGIAAPSGMDDYGALNYGPDAYDSRHVQRVAHEEVSAGATGTRTGVNNGSAGRWHAQLIAINGAPAGYPVVESVSTKELTAPGATAITIDKPAGTAEGDLLLAFVSGYRRNGNELHANPSPSGWIDLFYDVQSYYFGRSETIISYKVAGASEGSDYTFNFSGNMVPAGKIFRVSNVDPASIVVDSSHVMENSWDTDPIIATSITATDNNLVFFMGCGGRDHATNIPSVGVPSEMIDQGQIMSTKIDSYTDIRHVQRVATQQVSAGATGTRTATNDHVQMWHAHLIAISGGPAAGYPTLVSAATNTAGTVIALTFNKTMADPAGKHGEFSFKIGTTSRTFSAAALDGTKINLTVSGDAIAYGSPVTVSYTKGTVVADDDTELQSFTDQQVTNNVPDPAKINIQTNHLGVATVDLPNGNYSYKLTKEGLFIMQDTFTVAGANKNIDITIGSEEIPYEVPYEIPVIKTSADYASVIYIDPDYEGGDSDGTIEKPYTNFNTQYSSGIPSNTAFLFKHGTEHDILCMREDRAWQDDTLRYLISGMIMDNVFIGAYGDGDPIADMPKIGGVYCSMGGTDIVIRGIHLTRQSTNVSAADDAFISSHQTIDGLTVAYCHLEGIYMSGSLDMEKPWRYPYYGTRGTFRNFIFYRNIIHNVMSNGLMYWYGHNSGGVAKVIRNWVYDYNQLRERALAEDWANRSEEPFGGPGDALWQSARYNNHFGNYHCAGNYFDGSCGHWKHTWHMTSTFERWEVPHDGFVVEWNTIVGTPGTHAGGCIFLAVPKNMIFTKNLLDNSNKGNYYTLENSQYIGYSKTPIACGYLDAIVAQSPPYGIRDNHILRRHPTDMSQALSWRDVDTQLIEDNEVFATWGDYLTFLADNLPVGSDIDTTSLATFWEPITDGIIIDNPFNL